MRNSRKLKAIISMALAIVMVLTSTVVLSPKKAEEFKAFMTAKTGLPWLKVTPFCFINRALFYRRKKAA